MTLCGVQPHCPCLGLHLQRPRCCTQGSRQRIAQQAPYLVLLGHIVHHHLGPQHKHAQALQGLRQQVVSQDQPDIVGRGFETDETGLHTPFGIAKRRQTSLVGWQQQKIIAQLVVQKIGSVCALGVEDAEVGQGAATLGRT